MAFFKRGDKSGRNAPHLELGRLGEDAAASFLQKRGLKLLERNWRPGAAVPADARGLELDIIASDGDTLVFVEVKTRRLRSDSDFTALDNFSTVKQARLRKAATLYLDEKELWDQSCRFDLVCVTVSRNGAGGQRIDYYQNALPD